METGIEGIGMRMEEPTLWKCTRKEYYEMADMGWFDDQRVELLEGEIYLRSPPAPEPSPRLFTREEYYNMAELGWFGDTRVELIEGEIVEVSPPLGFHSNTVTILHFLFVTRLPMGFVVRSQQPMLLGLSSNPEPDVAIVKGVFADFKDRHPSHAELVIEVCESTLRSDRTRKASLYARAGIQEYWIVNLIDRCVEVYRDPVEKHGYFFGYDYATKSIHREGDEISPLFLPTLRIAVKEVLP